MGCSMENSKNFDELHFDRSSGSFLVVSGSFQAVFLLQQHDEVIRR